MCITPLVLNGKINIDASVSRVQTREMRGRRAKIALINVNLELNVIDDIGEEKMPVYSDEINSLLQKYDVLGKKISEIEKVLDKEKFFKDSFSVFDNKNEYIEKEHQVLYIKGRYGQVFGDINLFSCALADIQKDINDNNDFFYQLYCFITDGKISKQLVGTKGKYICEHNGVYIIIFVEHSYGDVFDVHVKGYVKDEILLLGA